MKASEIKAKFQVLKDAKLKLRNSTATERSARIKALWEATSERQEDLFKAGKEERGLHNLDVAAELMMLKAEAEFTIKNIASWMKPEKVKNSMSTMGKRCEIRRQSKGVVLNAGNSMVIKPSELAPTSAQIIEEIVSKVFPEDEALVIQGGVDVAKTLLELPFDHIYYTGGTAVGKIVMKAAADNLASVTLEMGGKNPAIIDASAKLENAASKLAWGRVMNAGQVCIAPDYVIVHNSVKEEFQTLLAAKIDEHYNSENTGLENSEFVPRIINERHTKRVKSLIDDAIQKGATVISGGGADIEANYIEPTLLTDVTEDMSVMQEEAFGPVMCILGYDTREDVLEFIKPRQNPLALYIYSTDKTAIEYFLENTSSGSAVVNNNCVQSGTNPRLPFGGVGSSGMGRIGGYEGFKTMSNERSIVHQPLDKFRDFLIQLPPYSDRYSSIIMKGIKK